MQTRVALISIIVEDYSSTEEINKLLHEYRQFIIGRMGIPYEKKKIGIISVAMDAPQPEISALAGKLGMQNGIAVKTLYSNVMGDE